MEATFDEATFTPSPLFAPIRLPDFHRGHAGNVVDHAASQTARIFNPLSTEVILWALETDSFWLISQGIFDEKGERTKGELLVRLCMDEQLYPPALFLSIIENELWMKTEFDYRIIEKAFRLIALRAPNETHTINVNPSTFLHPDFLDTLDTLQDTYKANPRKIILEILETEPINDYVFFNRLIEKLHARWYRIAVDDFHPIGNHNLFCVDHLQWVDIVKFDGKYVSELYHRYIVDWKGCAVTELREMITYIRQCHGSHVEFVAEKIETQGMLDAFGLIDSRIKYFQGFFFERGNLLWR